MPDPRRCGRIRLIRTLYVSLILGRPVRLFGIEKNFGPFFCANKASDVIITFLNNDTDRAGEISKRVVRYAITRPRDCSKIKWNAATGTYLGAGGDKSKARYRDSLFINESILSTKAAYRGNRPGHRTSGKTRESLLDLRD